MSKTTRKLSKKVCLLGDFSVGKTSLVRRFVEGRFDERYLSTIGVKVDRRVLQLDMENSLVEMTVMLWDLAGGPDAGPVVPSYYRGASGAVIACDLTRPDTVAAVNRYVEGFNAVNPMAALTIAANKVDLVDDRRVNDEDLASAATSCNAALFLTSAKTGEQVEEMFQQIGQRLAGA